MGADLQEYYYGRQMDHGVDYTSSEVESNVVRQVRSMNVGGLGQQGLPPSGQDSLMVDFFSTDHATDTVEYAGDVVYEYSPDYVATTEYAQDYVQSEYADNADDNGVYYPGEIARLGRHITDSDVYDSLDAMTLDDQEKFFALFSNRFASCVKRGKEGDWRQTSQFHHLSDEEIIEAISGGSTFLRACMADKTIRFVVVTVEESSYYRTSEGLEKIRDCLRCLSVDHLKLYLCEDSHQWQLFAFFQRPVDSRKIGALLSSWFRRNGIVPGTAGVRLFPDDQPFGLPLQPGFAWLNDDGQVIVTRNEISLEAALALFVSDVQRSQNDGDDLLRRLEQILGSDK